MKIIVGYFAAAIKALLALFGIAVDEEFASNLDSMISGLEKFEPETEEDSIKL